MSLGIQTPAFLVGGRDKELTTHGGGKGGVPQPYDEMSQLENTQNGSEKGRMRKVPEPGLLCSARMQVRRLEPDMVPAAGRRGLCAATSRGWEARG